MKQSFFVFALLSSAFFAQAQDEITYSEHIAPIIYSKCTNCHRGGEIGPISFTSYEEVSEWAGMIKYVTQIKYMPPWPPNPEYNHFVGERVLDEEEIQMISDWVDAGTPRGDPAKEPPLPQFTSGSQVGTPDLVLSMSEQYSIEGNNRDDYRVFVLPTGFTEDTEIASIEFRPDNKRAVHHVLIAYDVSGRAAARDAQSPDVYGYPSFGDFGISEAVQLSWVYVPGISPVVYPEGIGHTIPAGADLLIQVHYAPLPTDEVDKSSVNIFFKDASDPIEREVNQGLVFPELLPNGFFDFVIRPNTKPTFTARGIVVGNQEIQNIPFDISLISVLPHSHYLGKSYEIFAVTPSLDTLNIIQIEDWDFNWQGSYTMERMLKIPAGSRLFTIASYDNTTDNPANPSNPPRTATWGDGSQDEMLVAFFYFVPYQDGDEDIDMGGGTIVSTKDVVADNGNRLLPPIPNPTRGQVELTFSLQQKESLQFELYATDGRRLQVIAGESDWPAGDHQLSFDASALPNGAYLVQMKGASYVLTQRLVVLR